MTPEWETVSESDVEGNYESLRRMRVPGGWIYRYYVSSWSEGDGLKGISVAITFVPDPAAARELETQADHSAEADCESYRDKYGSWRTYPLHLITAEMRRCGTDGILCPTHRAAVP